jgi:hypothetical protein
MYDTPLAALEVNPCANKVQLVPSVGVTPVEDANANHELPLYDTQSNLTYGVAGLYTPFGVITTLPKFAILYHLSSFILNCNFTN